MDKETVKLEDGGIVITKEYDNSAVIEDNKRAQIETHGKRKYGGSFVHVGSLHVEDVVRLKRLGYDLFAVDQDEVRRALLYIQSNEPHLLTVEGKPFAKQRAQWH